MECWVEIVKITTFSEILFELYKYLFLSYDIRGISTIIPGICNSPGKLLQSSLWCEPVAYLSHL